MDAYQEEPLEKLKTYPVFQHLRAKAETHALKFRAEGKPQPQAAGEVRAGAGRTHAGGVERAGENAPSGSTQLEAEEHALPHILLPAEKSEAQTASPKDPTNEAQRTAGGGSQRS